MIQRHLDPLQSNSFFLFGARGTGKSTFIQHQFKMKSFWHIDLLDISVEDQYARVPKRLEQELIAMKKRPEWIVIDEIQKVPRLLDMVHRLIENEHQKFILTGSSARKLKRGAANLLAGRAFVYELFPLTVAELGDSFKLDSYMRLGGLPKLQSLATDREKKTFLSGYVLNYLNEEIRLEQVVRKLDPFRAFLPIVGQMAGKKINHKKIADEVGVDTKTVQNYFQILEDTLLGFYLPAFHPSVRKAQSKTPKFYLFDIGVQRALMNALDDGPTPKTSAYGELFESFVIMEILKATKYFEKTFKMSYFEAKNGAEVDLVLSKGNQHTLIEIKSSHEVNETEVRALSRLANEFPNCKNAYYLSQDVSQRKIAGVQCLPYSMFLNAIRKPSFK